ncbi:MAG: hypothetical protein A2589_00130 [Candidatus Vogelbacteria bacterium RIFOXYD1_FULL_46_19]|uniref:EamA domain-containing protein n=1 Tax=Candidatus Vogelbacteria bacterium RIFOXYD1_FULL_46_19 TaxID=1802439 RepID=A0A1G2QIA2_9BACT|nr:MAG: hypothetical protein A2589_00130 [Candidatus Vogelbacteria bacterium RIFOXYD1_FULL_46_19]
MSWFFVAIAAPILWSIGNHIDKLLLEKYFKTAGISTLMVFSSLIGFLAMPVLYWLNPLVFNVTPFNLAILIASGLLETAALYLYFVALADDEASVVVVFYQLVPVFGYILGFFILNEILNSMQLAAMALIIIGALIISIDVDRDNRFHLKTKTAFLMTLAAFFSSFESVLFKLAAVEESLWISLFWQSFSLALVGLFLVIGFRSCRQGFVYMVKRNSAGVFSINILNEILVLVGNFLFAYSFILAPVALVLLVNSYQPLSVLILGIILTLVFPNLVAEKIELKYIFQKLLAMVVVGVGTYLLFVA